MAILHCETLRHRAMAVPLAAVLALASLPALSQANDHYARVLTGQWKLVAALDGAHITALDENEAQHMLGKVFTIRKESVKFGDRTCGPSDFEAERVSPKIYFPEQFHASPDKLGLPNPVTAVDLSCTTVFIKNQDRLVIFWDGWFFDAARVKR